MIAALLLGVLAFAQDAPPVAGDGLRPSAFSAQGIVTDDSNTERAGAATVHFGWAHRAFVVQHEDVRAAVLREDYTASVTGGVAFGPLRIGVGFPVFLATSDRYEGVRTAPGDAGLDVHFVPFSANRKYPGFGITLRVTAPLGGSRLGLGWGGVAWESTALLDGHAGPVWLALQAGVRTVPTVRVGEHTLDTSAVVREAVSVRFTPRGGMTLEWLAAVGLLHPLARETTPIEAILSGWVDVDQGLSLRVGASAAVLSGLGAPPVRAFLELHGEIARPEKPRN